MSIILLTGISGSGKSVSLNALEDSGYFCVDNLPPKLLKALVKTIINENENKLAVAVDARSAISLAELPKDINWLRNQGYHLDVIFLTAKTDSLINRFSETRRSHPLSHKFSIIKNEGQKLTLTECIEAERELLSEIQEISFLIDTSGLSTNKLRTYIKDLVQKKNAPLSLLFESFAFKSGVPLDADLVFDARILTNPFYDESLRFKSGMDAEVINFLNAQIDVTKMFEDIKKFIENWLPYFKKDNRSYLTVAIGCTGGQHRSVFLTEKLASYFLDKASILTRHRDLY